MILSKLKVDVCIRKLFMKINERNVDNFNNRNIFHYKY